MPEGTAVHKTWVRTLQAMHAHQRERCKCRAVQLLPEGPQQGKAFLEATQTLQLLLLPGLLGWLLQWCWRTTLTAAKVPRPCRAS